jgi:adenine C2-methylase RlmN of 23S rRNA A2503 and tRNA A37
VLEVVGQAVSVAGGVAGIFTFLWTAKDRAAKANRRTNIEVGRMGEPPVPLDDVDEALLRELLGLDGDT